MKVDSNRFVQRFVEQARQQAPQADIPALPGDQVQLSAGRKSWLGRLFTPAAPKLSPAQLQAAQSQSMAAAVGALGGAPGLALAQKVAIEMFDATTERASGLAFRQENQATVQSQGTAPERASRLWSRLAPLLPPDIEAPTVLDKGGVGPGMFVGRSVFINPDSLAELDDDTATFLLAHEAGHILNRDASRKAGMAELVRLVDGDLAEARSGKDHDIEFAADARAAELAKQVGCDPRPILKTLLTWPGGDTHPDGLQRATRVRALMGGVSEAEWADLLTSTQATREQAQAQLNNAQDWLRSFDGLV